MSPRYQVLGPIASGGMAEVYRVRMASAGGFEKVLAMKRIAGGASADPEAVKMLMDEARLAARLSHPNIVQVFDFDQDEDGYFLTMEYVEGPDLSSVLREYQLSGRLLSEPCATWICIQVLWALDYAHKRTDAKGKRLNLVHRDVSPGNILVTSDGVAKLSDFGIAWAMDRLQQTGVGVLKGKLAYMSPEQARTERVDARSDVFALGLVLWECLAGMRCYDSPDELRVLRNVQAGRVRSFHEVGINVPGSLEAIVMQALAREPEQRFQSAGEMAEALERYHRKVHPNFTPEYLGAALSGTVPGASLPPEWTRVNEVDEHTRRVELPAEPPLQTGPKSDETMPVVHLAPRSRREADEATAVRAHPTRERADEVMADVAEPKPLGRRVTGQVPQLPDSGPAPRTRTGARPVPPSQGSIPTQGLPKPPRKK